MQEILIPEHKRFRIGFTEAPAMENMFGSFDIGQFRLTGVDSGIAVFKNPNSKGPGFMITPCVGGGYMVDVDVDISYGDIADLLDIFFEKNVFSAREVRDNRDNFIPGVGWIIRNDVEQALVVKTSNDMAVAVTFPKLAMIDSEGVVSYYNPHTLAEAIERLCA